MAMMRGCRPHASSALPLDQQSLEYSLFSPFQKNTYFFFRLIIFPSLGETFKFGARCSPARLCSAYIVPRADLPCGNSRLFESDVELE